MIESGAVRIDGIKVEDKNFELKKLNYKTKMIKISVEKKTRYTQFSLRFFDSPRSKKFFIMFGTKAEIGLNDISSSSSTVFIL